MRGPAQSGCRARAAARRSPGGSNAGSGSDVRVPGQLVTASDWHGSRPPASLSFKFSDRRLGVSHRSLRPSTTEVLAQWQLGKSESHRACDDRVQVCTPPPVTAGVTGSTRRVCRHGPVTAWQFTKSRVTSRCTVALAGFQVHWQVQVGKLSSRDSGSLHLEP